MDARERLAEEIFKEALDLAPGERSELIARRCGEDLALLQRVESLLSSLEAAGDFLGGAAARTGPEDEEREGARIGRYRLGRLLGEGGFGSVYLAHQEEPVERLVALKVIKSGMDTRQVVARFQAERQALALMDHPGIARVFDAGTTPRGRPYFVMEYVSGTPITEYVENHSLSLRARLELFEQVCRAVQHAHQKGIIHRDLKPSNVLVVEQDGEPTPKVIDFGIAKAIDRRLTAESYATLEHQVIGTPQAMAPEQAGGSLDIDTRADVYSLGALLYEVLTQRPPFSSEELLEQGFEGMLRVIRETDPQIPSRATSTFQRELVGDLDWIVMKALEKERTRRYDTADGLAEDIRRHLACEPVLAGPPSAAYRLTKFMRRNRIGVVSTAVVALGLVVGIGLALFGLQEARAERDKARLQVQVNEAILQYLNQDLLAAVSPDELGRDVTMLDVLDSASANVEQRFPDEPLVEASVRRTIGNTYRKLGQPEIAHAHLRWAFDTLRERLGMEDPKTLMAANQLATTLADLSRLEEALELRTRIAELEVRLRGRDGDDAMTYMNNLGRLYTQLHRYAEAEEILLENYELRKRVLGPEHRYTLISMGNVGNLYLDMLRYEEAEAWIQGEYELCRRVMGEEHPDTLTSQNNLGVLFQHLGKNQEGLDVFRDLIDKYERVMGPDHPKTLSSMLSLAANELSNGPAPETETLILTALDRAESNPHISPQTVLRAKHHLSRYHQKTGDDAAAEEVATEALEYVAEEGLEGDESHAQLLLTLGLINMKRGWNDVAESLLLESLDVIPPSSFMVWEHQLILGEHLGDQGRWEEAEPYYLAAGETIARLYPPEAVHHVAIPKTIARMYEAWGKPEQAAEWWAAAEEAQPRSTSQTSAPK